MVRINRVYTRSGDRGTTRLAGGQEISKSASRIEAYGTVDELNANLGLAWVAAKQDPSLVFISNRILRIQNELFNLGSQLAVLKEDRRNTTPLISNDDILRLEEEIDQMNGRLSPLNSFILPGGGEVSARLHVARTVCRRAERLVVKLSAEDTLDGPEIPYLNRLSDWLFVAARYANHLKGIKEHLWKP